MMDLVNAQISQQLSPLVDRLLELETELEDLRRRSENFCRIGTIESVDPGTGRAVISHGELKTPAVRYFNPSAGEQSETRHPSVGEQVLLLNYGGGDSSAQTVALGGIPSDAFPPTSTTANVTCRTYKDGTASAYDHDAHRFTWANGPLTVTADQSGVEVMLGGVGFRLSSSGFEHVGAEVTHDGTNIGKDHLHKDTQPQAGAVSGPPQ